MNITENITRLKASLPAGVTLVAVSKFHPVEALQEAYNAGQRVFGESRAQELTAKQKVLPSDIEWHFIGPLQSNKVKDVYKRQAQGSASGYQSRSYPTPSHKNPTRHPIP